MSQDPVKFTLPQGSWEEAEARLGEILSVMEGVDEVNLSDIRRKLEVMGFDCPLHYDEEAAQRYGYRTVISPVTMVASWSLPAYWSPGDPPLGDDPVMPPFPLVEVPAPGTAVLGTNVETEFYEPVYPGDRITCENRLVDIIRKETRIGEGAFMTVESTYRKQSGEVVAIDRFTSFRYTPTNSPDARRDE